MKAQRDNSGIMFVNDKKTKDAHPDRKGSATIGGVEYWVSGWIKEGDRGKFLSLAFEPKKNADVKAPVSTSRGQVDRGGIADMPDECPF